MIQQAESPEFAGKAVLHLAKGEVLSIAVRWYGVWVLWGRGYQFQFVQRI